MEQETLGQYRLIARVATGGMAELFLARREGVAGFRKTVAIKRLLPHLSRDPDVVRMFLNEAHIASRLEHPNIVQVFDLGQVGADYYMAMEFLHGRTLSEVQEQSAKRGELVPIGLMARVVADACAGLHYAHEAKDGDGLPLEVVHRDFNPSNVFVTYDGRVKVLDFGIAKIQSLSHQSEPGILRGKYYYMSPEMVGGRAIDRRADLFAAGVMLYELATGRRPFEGEDVNQLLKAIATGDVQPPHEIDPSIPPALDALCLGLLSKNPDDRPGSAAAVRASLERLLASGPKPVGTAELAAYMTELFPEEDPERRRLEALRGSEPTPAAPAAPPVAALAPPLPLALPAPPPRSQPARRFARGRIRVVGLALVIVAGGGAILLRGRTRAAPSRVDPLASAEAALGAGHLDAARAALERAVRDDPANARAHALLGETLARQRLGQRAEAELREALRLAPGSLAAYRSLATLETEQGDLAGAEKTLVAARGAPLDDPAGRRAHAVKPRRPADASTLAVDRDLGLLEGRLGRWTQAAALLGGVVKQRPTDAEAWANLGYAHYQLHDDSRAASELALARRLDPGLAVTYYYEGFLDYREGHPRKAIESYRAAAARDPHSAAALIALGQLYQAEKRAADSREAYAQALARDPDNASAKAALAAH